ncbi:MAG: hypothetical protein WBZ42_03560 [Halobacteriota archaeon]
MPNGERNIRTSLRRENSINTKVKRYTPGEKLTRPRCTICKLPGAERDALEEKIASKELSITKGAELVNSNKATLSRHMNRCVPKRIRESMKPEPVAVEGLNVVNALTESRGRILSIYDEARQSGDLRAAIAALQTEVSQMSLMARITGQLNDAPQVNFLLNPEFVRLKQILIKTLEPYPEARVRLSEALTEMIADDGEDDGKNGKDN